MPLFDIEMVTGRSVTVEHNSATPELVAATALSLGLISGIEVLATAGGADRRSPVSILAAAIVAIREKADAAAANR